MEAANRGAYDVGAKSIGLNIHLPCEQYPQSYITPELCFRFHYFALRKLHFLMRARALVAFPGGYGTLDELFETLTLIQTRTIKPVPVVLVGESYWRQAVNVDFLAAEGVIDPEDRELFWYADTAQEIWDGILHWHEVNGNDYRGEFHEAVFHGADRSVTGSCHLVECAGRRILIDCGMYQGGRELAEENAEPFGFDPESIDFVLLTHAHLDHAVACPPGEAAISRRDHHYFRVTGIGACGDVGRCPFAGGRRALPDPPPPAKRSSPSQHIAPLYHARRSK